MCLCFDNVHSAEPEFLLLMMTLCPPESRILQLNFQTLFFMTHPASCNSIKVLVFLMLIVSHKVIFLFPPIFHPQKGRQNRYMKSPGRNYEYFTFYLEEITCAGGEWCEVAGTQWNWSRCIQAVPDTMFIIIFFFGGTPKHFGFCLSHVVSLIFLLS